MFLSQRTRLGSSHSQLSFSLRLTVAAAREHFTEKPKVSSDGVKSLGDIFPLTPLRRNIRSLASRYVQSIATCAVGEDDLTLADDLM